MVGLGPVLLCWFFLLVAAIPASILIAIGEIRMAAFYYYPIAGIALAIWACRDPSRVLTAIVSGRARAAAVEAYLAG